MAVGDKLVGYSNNLADDGTLDIQAAAAGEATIHNLFATSGAAWELYWNDGTNTLLIGSYNGSLLGYVFHVQASDGKYLTMKNVSGGAADLGYSGVVTK